MTAILFNGLDLMMEGFNEDGWRLHALAQSDEGQFSLGDAEVVIAQIASQLADGDVSEISRRGNRTITIPVVAEADPQMELPGQALDAAGDAVEHACSWSGYADLTYLGPLDGTATRVYEMWHASPNWAWADIKELNGKQRVYLLTVEARPFSRAVEITEFAAPPVPPQDSPPSDVVVDDGTSTTGWAASGTIAANGTDSTSMGVNVAPFTGMVYASATHRDAPHPDGIAGHYACTALGISVTATRAATIAADPSRPYMVVTGRARYRTGTYSGPFGAGYYTSRVVGAWKYDGTVSFTDAAGTTVTPSSFRVTDATGGWEATFAPGYDLDGLAVKYAKPFTLTMYYDAQVGIDAITQSAGAVDGVFTGYVQSRQIEVPGPQRTDLTLRLEGRGVGTGVEQLADGGFEAGISDWSTVGSPANFAWSTTQHYAGTHSLEASSATGLNPADYVQSDAFAVIPGQVVTVEGQHYSAATGRRMDIAFYSDVAGTNMIGSLFMVATATLTNAWRSFTATATAPDGAASARAIVRIGGYYDAMSFKVAPIVGSPLGNQAMLFSGPGFVAGRAASGLTGTSESACLSATKNSLTAAPTTMTFDASTFTPGDRLVLARVMASTATTQTLTIASETETISATVISNGSPTWPDLLTNTYSVIPVGVMTLPPRDATSGTFDLDITATALTLDDLYFAPLDGELTLLDVSGTYDGHDVEVVELSSASTGSPVPTIRVGLADGTYMTDLEPGRVLAWGQHQGNPGTQSIASIADGCQTADLSGRAYARRLL